MEAKRVQKRMLRRKRNPRIPRLPKGCGNKNFMGTMCSRVHEWTVPIYSYSNSAGTNGYYTFNTNATQAYIKNLTPDLFGLHEYTSLAEDFQLFRIKGCTLELRSTVNGSAQTSMVSSAQLFVDLLLSNNNITAAGIIPTSQTAIKMCPSTATGVVKKYYSFPDLLVGNQGYPQAGRSVWYNSGQISSATSAINIIAAIGFTNYSAATGIYNYPVAELTFKFYLDWAKPVRCVL